MNFMLKSRIFWRNVNFHNFLTNANTFGLCACVSFPLRSPIFFFHFPFFANLRTYAPIFNICINMYGVRCLYTLQHISFYIAWHSCAHHFILNKIQLSAHIDTIYYIYRVSPMLDNWSTIKWKSSAFHFGLLSQIRKHTGQKPFSPKSIFALAVLQVC